MKNIGKIEKLNTEVFATSVDGYNWVYHPTKDDIVDKINELIDCLNTVFESEGEK